MTSALEKIQWRVPSLGALLLVLVFMPHLFSKVPYVNAGSGAGGSMLGDVNISAILDSFSVSYDKRVRPNYGGKQIGF